METWKDLANSPAFFFSPFVHLVPALIPIPDESRNAMIAQEVVDLRSSLGQVEAEISGDFLWISHLFSSCMFMWSWVG